MKTLIASLFAFLLLFSCKEEKSEFEQMESHNVAVGKIANGEILMEDIAAIKQKWEKAVEQETKGAKLEGFEIVKGTPENNPGGEYYMLLARTDDGSVMTSALLKLDSDKLFLASNGEGDMPLVICKGLCSKGCMPIVTASEGELYINCTPCLDCTKKEMTLR